MNPLEIRVQDVGGVGGEGGGAMIYLCDYFTRRKFPRVLHVSVRGIWVLGQVAHIEALF